MFPETPISSDLPEPGYIAQDLLADRDFPPFDRVAMDGIAIRYAAWKSGQRSFQLQGTQTAGQPAKALSHPNGAIEVMTGTMIPLGCDTVIRYEDFTKEASWANLSPEIAVKPGQNVHRRGLDGIKGTCLVPRGARLQAPQWAIAATIGQGQVATYSGPRISIIATGDELVSLHDMPLPHQIRVSNSTALMAASREQGFRNIKNRLASDQIEDLKAVIEKELETSDFCILTGAVSMGKYDFVPFCLKELGVSEIFHKVRQRPGKPLWFGKTYSGTLVFGLPGNPVSALVSFYKYVLPAFHAWQSPAPPPHQRFARLSQNLSIPHGANMGVFVPVTIEYGSDAVLYAKPQVGIGSGDLASLAQSDGFIECQEGSIEYPKGTVVPLVLWGLQ